MAMTPKEQIEFIVAFERGEEVQFVLEWAEDWRAAITCLPGHEFNFQGHRYRKKPKPLELWVNVYDSGQTFVHRSEEAARHALESGRTVHMREVVGE